MMKCNICGKKTKMKNICNLCSNKITKNTDEYKTKMKKSIKESRLKEVDYNGALYSINTTKKILNIIDWSKYLGSGKQRTFIKEREKLYFSIKKHSKSIAKSLNYSKHCLESDIILIIKGLDYCMCICGKTLRWDYEHKKFMKSPRCCGIPNNTLEKKKLLYGEKKGKDIYDNLMIKFSEARQGFLSLEYFKNKFEKGEEEYQKYWEYNFSKRKNLPYSKISQELFDYIKDNSNLDHNYLMYATLNQEMRINFNKKDKEIIGEKRVCMFVDFRYKDKIIEFDGEYWHKDSKDLDEKRDIILKNKGYKVLRINELDYKNNKEGVVKLCLNFLTSL